MCLVGKDFQTRVDVGQGCVEMPKSGSMLLSTGTGGIEVSPPGPKPFMMKYILSSYLFFSKEILQITHMH